MAANRPLWVGGFALGGLAVAALAIVLLGGRHLFAQTVQVAVVFNGSVAGLGVGSPVTFRGVRIGEVKAMTIQVDAEANSGVIPVIVELDSERISWTGAGGQPSGTTALRKGVARGLRAQLASQSLITGQLSIDLDFHPEASAVPERSVAGLFEIPSIPSDLQTFKEEFRRLDLRGIADDARRTLATLQKVLADVDGRVGPIADSLRTTLDTTAATERGLRVEIAQTLQQIDLLAAEARGQLATNGKDLDQLIRTAGRTADQAERLVTSLNEMTAPQSPMRGDLEASLRDLAASADSLRTLTRDLQRNPAGTLFGRSSK
jgi:paraquat-inducible protein B